MKAKIPAEPAELTQSSYSACHAASALPLREQRGSVDLWVIFSSLAYIVASELLPVGKIFGLLILINLQLCSF